MESRNRELNNLLHFSIDLTATSDIKGLFLHVNSEWEEIFGFKEEELVGKRILDFVHPDDYYIALRIISKLRNNKTVKDFKIRFKKKNGNFKTLKLRVFPLEKTIFGTARDITERLVYEEHLKAAKEKAEESEKLKTAFIANMSHEIRTPLNGIIGFTNLLKTNHSEEKKEKFLKIIEQSGEQLLNVVNDILDISKIQSGQIIPKNDTINLSTFLEEVTETFSFEATQKSIALKFSNISGRECIIKNDKLILKQIFSNLISNAIKYTQKGEVSVTLDHDTKNVSVSVEDSGFGIPDEMKDRIFERFVRIEDPEHANIRGTGLGLSIVKALCNVMGAKITLHSKLGIGSTFTVTFSKRS